MKLSEHLREGETIEWLRERYILLAANDLMGSGVLLFDIGTSAGMKSPFYFEFRRKEDDKLIIIRFALPIESMNKIILEVLNKTLKIPE